MKFGGTSLEDAEAFSRVRHIIGKQAASRPVVIASAMSRVTDALLKCVSLAAENPEDVAASHLLDEHLGRHLDVARALLSLENQNEIAAGIESARREIAELLKTLAARPALRPQLQDVILSYGERLSANLLTAVLREGNLHARYVDARRCIVTNAEHGRAEPFLPETERRTRGEIEPLLEAASVPVLGGFIGASEDGMTTTLGRGGSDYTAALVGAALSAREIQIWTDVTGVLTADPRVIESARTIRRLSYAEAAELAYFGAKVLHPKTIQPAVEQRIPVRVCNSRLPEEDGTLVSFESEPSPQIIKAIAHKTGVTIVQITSARMLGTHGFLHALFDIFNRHRMIIDVVATSEISVSLSLDDASALPHVIEELKQLGEVSVEPQRAIICVVGEGLGSTPGIAARVFNCLTSINISLISQGASSINLTFVIAETDLKETLRLLHAGFFASDVNATAVGEISHLQKAAS
jgi:aspartate kinase